jgi:hypothetical protein
LITKIKLIIYLAKFIAIKYFQEIKSLKKRNLISIKIILRGHELAEVGPSFIISYIPWSNSKLTALSVYL